MRRGRGMGNASTARTFPEADSIRPGRQHNIGNRIKQRAAQRAVVVFALGLGRDRHAATMRCDDLLDNGKS